MSQNPMRRTLLKGIAALPLIGPLAALQARAASRETLLIASPYGPLRPVQDQSTGLSLLRLPQGFSYASFGWTGDRMANGMACPGKHDGMGVVSTRGGEITLVRNHEVSLGQDTHFFGAPAVYDRGLIGGMLANGGNTVLRFRDGKWVDVLPALGGTLANCAGGVTPWGTWLSCEEVGADDASSSGMKHGYVFEVSPDASSSAQPIVGMGRFRHEAVAIDPASGIVYMTEDDSGKSGFYRYLPKVKDGKPGSLAAGGVLQMARVAGDRNANIAAAAVGQAHPLKWVDIADPDANRGKAEAEAGGKSISNASGPFRQGWAQGALRMNRGEGIACHDGKVYVMDTTGGEVKSGAIWELDLETQILRCIYASRGMLFGNMGDNITVSPRGGLLMCEDANSTAVDEYGAGERLMGLTQQGEVFVFAKNNYAVDAEALLRAGKSAAHAGNKRDSEFCGACFDATGKFLFVNAQEPGITYAITGPWQHGPL
jgi:secreted PhoX family phosphatase